MFSTIGPYHDKPQTNKQTNRSTKSGTTHHWITKLRQGSIEGNSEIVKTELFTMESQGQFHKNTVQYFLVEKCFR